MFVDSAEPALVEELYRAGFNAQLAKKKKKKKDVNTGISFCKTHYGVTVTPNGINDSGYSWKKKRTAL
jgi:hypothetical protein